MSTKFNDDTFASLPFPLRSCREILSMDPTNLFDDAKDFFGSGLHRNKSGWIQPKAEVSAIDLGRLKILATKTTPCISFEEGSGVSTLAMPYYGDCHRYKEGGLVYEIKPEDIHLSPRTGGIADVGCFSGFILEIDHRRLNRVLRVLGKGEEVDLSRPFLLKGRNSTKDHACNGALWSCISLIDQIIGEYSYATEALCLDDQIYRLLALGLLKTQGRLGAIQKRCRTRPNNWTEEIDNLVDYIQANSHLPLTLTDLEEASNYSARHLQNLFRDKFDCTPMQFVRRQRLQRAMERLENSGDGETVANIARDCGYRFASSFSADFQKEFGISPSSVLRGSR
jgi:AraC-like DNA-binding protein